MEKYSELKHRQQREFDALPLGFAFSDRQFEEMMSRWNLDAEKDLDKIYSIGYGGYIRKADANLLHEIRERHDKEFEDMIASDTDGTGFIYQMFLCELANHEYSYTMDVTDTLEALGYTTDDLQKDKRLLNGLKKAKQKILSA